MQEQLGSRVQAEKPRAISGNDSWLLGIRTNRKHMQTHTERTHRHTCAHAHMRKHT